MLLNAMGPRPSPLAVQSASAAEVMSTRSRDVPSSGSKVHETNIGTVLRLEAEQDRRVPPSNRLSEAIGRFAGTNAFVALQTSCVAAWMAVNTGSLRGLPVFDPYPFPLLALVLALEAVLLTSFVLIRQNGMSLKADRRSHLDLQINLLAEKEVTKIIQLLRRISEQLGVEDEVADPETRELSKDTEVEEVARDLRKELEEEAED